MSPKKGKRSGSSKMKSKKSQSPTPQGKTGHPEDIFPLTLTSATQNLFGCQIDEDVTAQSPYKLLKKDDIMQDIKTRAAVSDFSPAKQIVLDYPEEEILLVFDSEFTFGQSFYLVLSPEAKNRILKLPETETPEVLENEVDTARKPKQWVSLGSEKEIEEESVKEREPLVFTFSRKRRFFGLPVSFSDNITPISQGFPSYEDNRRFIPAMLTDCGTQAVPKVQSSTAQTNWLGKRNNSTHYEPRDLSEEEKEVILQSDSMKEFLRGVTPRMLHALQQEEIFNLFTDDLKDLGADVEDDNEPDLSKGLELFKTFTDPSKGKKISSVNWHPSINGVIAVALKMQREEESDSEEDLSLTDPKFIAFYSFADLSKPQLLLECPADVVVFEFCPSNPNIIVGGCANGQVALWDISAEVTFLTQPGSEKVPANPFDLRKEQTPEVLYSAASEIESSHKAAVTDVQWLPPTFEVTRTGLPVENTSKLCVQVITCSPDCTIMFWDVRLPKQAGLSLFQRPDQNTPMTRYIVPKTFKHLDRTWKPLFKVSFQKMDGSGVYAPLKLSFEPYPGNAEAGSWSAEDFLDYSQLRIPSAKELKTLEDVNTKIFIGTEEGEVVYTDWKLEKDEFGLVHCPKPLFSFSTHDFMVYAVQRSPFFKDIVLTVGTWNFAIWKEGVMEGPLHVSKFSVENCTAGCWSLTRPAVFFIGKDDGSMEVWDLLENTNGPSQVHPGIISGTIICIKPWIVSSKQHFLAVTNDHRVVRILEISKSLRTPTSNESSRMEEHFEWETKYVKEFDRRKKVWAKEKEEQELKKETKPAKPVLTPAEQEELDKKEYGEFLKLEESILKGLGLWPKPDHSDKKN
ncbi:dynein intermediate chain 3, axonemal isoform X2 [Kryptolebias marmoratus]|uniref:dynein intermediate chain 3, axonemal isoform X2 n=1 Tax=Kryptolebias marmoratus TaxID=37003 RepID=UPI0018AC92FF|nr:dynein intermediate chain 3, axonemal isoform X2 [Kryptolebias marmoratus]